MAEIRKERRKSPRFAITKSVLYNHANRLVSAKTEDIGSGGIRIISDLPLRKGDAFEFLVVLEGMGLKFKGTVVHSTVLPDSRVMAGIAFDPESTLSLSLLDGYLSSHNDRLPRVPGSLAFDQEPSYASEA
jgi:hypothetical protein